MPPTLGQRLKHAREKRGLSLRDLEHTTRIPAARLQDLEEDKLNTFGGMAYAKSFLRIYSALLDVNAGEVLGQIQTPPLGGVRDYKYLVESQGHWVDRRRYQAPLAPAAGLDGRKSFRLAAIICFVVLLMVGGGVVARGLFYTRSAQGSGSASSGSTGGEAGSAATGAYVSPDQLKQEQEFSVKNVSVSVAPESVVLKAIPIPPTPPKAQPVLESGSRGLPPPPKAQPVR